MLWDSFHTKNHTEMKFVLPKINQKSITKKNPLQKAAIPQKVFKFSSNWFFLKILPDKPETLQV